MIELFKQFYRDNYILIFIEDNKIFLGYIESIRNNTMFLKAYKEYNALDDCIINGIIFNTFFLIDLVQSFISQNKIKSSKLIIILDHKNIKQDLMSKSISNSLAQILEATDNYFINNEEIRIGSEELLYQVAIKNTQIFQYNLLALGLNLKLICLTTAFISCYYFYKFNCNDISDVIIDKRGTFNNLVQLSIFFKNLIAKNIGNFTKSWPENVIHDLNSDNLVKVISSYYLLVDHRGNHLIK